MTWNRTCDHELQVQRPNHYTTSHLCIFRMCHIFKKLTVLCSFVTYLWNDHLSNSTSSSIRPNCSRHLHFKQPLREITCHIGSAVWFPVTRGLAVERQSLARVLSPSCARIVTTYVGIRFSPPHSVEAPSGERLRDKGRHGVLCRLKVVWSMPERFRVVCTMQGAIQVLWFFFYYIKICGFHRLFYMRIIILCVSGFRTCVKRTCSRCNWLSTARGSKMRRRLLITADDYGGITGPSSLPVGWRLSVAI